MIRRWIPGAGPSQQSQSTARKTVKAAEIQEALALKSNRRSYRLQDAVVEGALDLRSCLVSIPLYIERCEFQGDVDIRSCHFQRVVNLSGCQFHGAVNAGDDTEAHTVFDADLILDAACFQSTICFARMQCSGSALFRQAQFLSADTVANFDGSFVGGNLDFKKSVWMGGASFEGARCSLEINFNGAEFRNQEMRIDLGYMSCGLGLNCRETVFAGGAQFMGTTCPVASFNKVSFKNGRTADFSGFHATRFAVFNDACFSGPARFADVLCEQALEFRNTIFWGKALFYGARSARLSFEGARFESTEVTDLRRSSLDYFLDLDRARIIGDVNLESASIVQTLTMQQTSIRGKLILRNAKIGRLALGGGLPFGAGGVDLRRCTFSTFDGEQELAMRLARAQHPYLLSRDPDGRLEREYRSTREEERPPFTRDPYMQLERYYRSIGDELAADALYFQGRSDFRKIARAQVSQVRWGRWDDVRDWLWKGLTGYGVKSVRLLVYILFFIVFGTLVFSVPKDALEIKTATLPKGSVISKTVTLPKDVQVVLHTPQANETSDALGWRLLYRAAYSLDLFLPVVDLEFKDRWEPHGGLAQVYAPVHVIAGWILIPLLVAAWSGIIKSE